MTPENFKRAAELNEKICRIKEQINRTKAVFVYSIEFEKACHIRKEMVTVCTDPEIIPIIADFIRKQLELKLVKLQNEFNEL